MSADALNGILNGLQERLQGGLRSGRAAVVHPGARGECSENEWREFLKDHLPRRYDVDKAFVVDSQGNTSDEIDIVIYDRQYSPFLYNQANQRFIPAESVYAVLEVKQSLNRDHVRYAGDKAASVRRLERTSASIPYAGGTYAPRDLPPVVAGIVTFESDWSPPFGRPFDDAVAGLAPDQRLDLGCVLTSGVFETSTSEEGEVSVVPCGASQAVLPFILVLLRRLQALGTAPAIDYGRYLASVVARDLSIGAPH